MGTEPTTMNHPSLASILPRQEGSYSDRTHAEAIRQMSLRK
jgi:hypothetical protein